MTANSQSLADRVRSAQRALPAFAGEQHPEVPAESWRLAGHVERLLEWCIAHGDELDGEGLARAAELGELAALLDTDAERVRETRMSGCFAALARLRGIGDTTELLRLSCEEAVRRCGFGRVVLSRVEGTVWRPWLGYAVVEGEMDSWFPEWVGRGIELDWRLPEARIVTEHRPAIVLDTSSVPVHRGIIVEAGRSSSYVVAPIVHRGTVIGFLHADHHPTAQAVDEVDRDVIWAFTVGLSHIYERTALEELFRTRRDETRGILSSAVDRIDELSRDLREDRSLPNDVALANLTAREYDVFRLMAQGATNAAIAARLVISEDTVKSHVKRILRKLGVANRSQAIAWTAR